MNESKITSVRADRVRGMQGGTVLRKAGTSLTDFSVSVGRDHDLLPGRHGQAGTVWEMMSSLVPFSPMWSLTILFSPRRGNQLSIPRSHHRDTVVTIRRISTLRS